MLSNLTQVLMNAGFRENGATGKSWWFMHDTLRPHGVAIVVSSKRGKVSWWQPDNTAYQGNTVESLSHHISTLKSGEVR